MEIAFLISAGRFPSGILQELTARSHDERTQMPRDDIRLGHIPAHWRKPLAPTRGAEEVDKQLVDAFTLVVMHPVRRVGQALDAVEVGYVSVVGLG
jgi:hypothetical protein